MNDLLQARFEYGVFEVVIAAGDVKLGHLERDPRCSILVREAELVDCDVREIRAEIAGRYLGADRGRRFPEERKTPGVLLRLRGDRREWDLSAILPS